MWKPLMLITAIMLVRTALVQAGPFEDGDVALQAGKYQEAVNLFTDEHGTMTREHNIN
jgi:hypothetical protein